MKKKILNLFGKSLAIGLGFGFGIIGAGVIAITIESSFGTGDALTSAGLTELKNAIVALPNWEKGDNPLDAAYMDGNVGVGTKGPATELDVNGTITTTGGNSTNWNTAYDWGNHASAGYLTSASDPKGVLGSYTSGSIEITSTTATEIESLSITDSGTVNVALNAHFSAEIAGTSSGRFQAEIRTTNCSGTILSHTMWRPGGSASDGSYNAVTISLTGFQASVIAPATFVVCARKYDTTFPDTLVFYRGFNLSYAK